MTATIKPPRDGGRPRRRVPHFSSLESLGFADSTHTWSDSPITPEISYRTPPPVPVDPIVYWDSTDTTQRLDGRNFRWSLIIIMLLIGFASGLTAWWLYERPIIAAEALSAEVVTQAEALDATLPALETFNDALIDPDAGGDTAILTTTEIAARQLFDSSAGLTESTTRSDAATASSSALDAVRLLGNAHAYSLAVTPMLLAPAFETDPERIELDAAARSFGEWHLGFDAVRTALPADILRDVTDQLTILSAHLPGLLTEYVEALGADDQPAAQAVVDDLAVKLNDVSQHLEAALADVQARVSTRISESREALGGVVGPATP